MAITAYCGVMGSGKSYEVVSGPLLDAVACGRRVITNVDGISEGAIHAYLRETRNVPSSRLGSIVHVRTDDLKRDHFFPVGFRRELLNKFYDVNAERCFKRFGEFI